MAKWIGYLGGGAAGAAVAVAGYVAWTLNSDPETTRETPAALVKPENGEGAGVVSSEPAAEASSEVAAVPEEASSEAKPNDETGKAAGAPEETDAAAEATAAAEAQTETDPQPDAGAVEETTLEADAAIADAAPEPAVQPETAIVQDADREPETAGVQETGPEPDTADVQDAGSEPANAGAPNTDPEPATAQQDTPEPDTATAEATSGLLPPTFDLVRIEPDGSAIVAGAGSARAQVRIFLDGGEIGEAIAGRDGRFVSLLHIPPSRQPRLMTLAMSLAEEEVFSKTEIIVAPFGEVAKPEPEQRTSLEAEATNGPVPETTEVASLEDDSAAGGEAFEQAGAEPTATEVTSEAEAGGNDVRSTEAEAGGSTTPEGSSDETEVAADTAGGAEPEAGGSTQEIAAASDVTELPGELAEANPEAAAEAENTALDGDRTTETGSETAAVEDRAATIAEGRVEAETVTETSEASDQAEAEVNDPTAPEVVIAKAEPLPVPEPAAGAEPEKSAMSETDTAESANAEPRDSAPVLPEPQAPPRLLASDDEGVRVLPGPEVLDRVAIDSISYDTAGDVALAGRGVTGETGGFVRVYLDNTPITTSRIRSDGSWRVTLPEIDKGVYTLRVDEVDDAGEVKSRAETPFLREDRQTLEEASEASAEGGPVKIVTVQPGNTLWQIARERYGEGILYVRVFDANKGQIRDPDLIYPGQVFDLPEEGAAE